MNPETILFLNGSPKTHHSTSKALSDFMADKLLDKDLEVKRVRISSYLKSDEKIEKLLQHVKDADLIVLVFPLYIDSLPYNVIEIMEIIQNHLGSSNQLLNTGFIALCQSGMEQKKNRIALKICECFAKTMGFQFGGAFALGFAGVLNGVPLNYLNRLTAKVQKALSIISESIAAGNPVPQKKVAGLLAKPLLPGPLFLKLFLFNNTMKNCRKEKNFNKGIEQLHAKLKLFYS